MNTAAQQSGSSGCSLVVVAMVTILALVIGILAGAGGLFGYLKVDGDAAAKLGIVAESSASAAADPAECPPCEEVAGGGEAKATPTYALVYPIEQTLRIEGQLDDNKLRDYVIKRRFELQKCYQKVLEKDSSIKGEVSLQFTISKSGKILAAVVRHDTVKSEELKQCVLDTIKAWEMSEDEVSSDIAVVKFDVLFTPIGANGM